VYWPEDHASEALPQQSVARIGYALPARSMPAKP
jgi:hypothetical protein